MSASASHRSVLRYIYNHNPFYVISAVLMLFAVRSAYGTIEIGSINCWIMMGVLAGYTLLLAGIGVLIVRWGKVWEDARSILLLLLLLFLGVSVSMDDLFSRISAEQGLLLMTGGFLFSALLSEAVLWGAGIRLGARYRIPYHLFLALFYAAPWWCSPEMHPRTPAELEWTLFLFPVVASVLFLCLLPAVRGGVAYVKTNGTPWGWPWFPWIAFGMIAACVGFRSFVLCLTFGPAGPMWIKTGSGPWLISFDTLWGFYFLIPLAFALLVLLLEGGLATGNKVFQAGLTRFAPLLLLLAMPATTGPVHTGFLFKMTDAIGSPIWLSVWLLIGFYLWAAFRRVPNAIWGGLGAVALLAIVGPQTLGSRTLIEPTPWPLLLDGALILALGIRKRSSGICTVGIVAATLGIWFVIPDSVLSEYRFTTCFHLLWISALVLGLTLKDDFSRVLQGASALLIPLVALVVIWNDRAVEIPMLWRLSYVAVWAVGSLLIAHFWSSRWFKYSFAATVSILLYTSAAYGFRQVTRTLDRSAVIAFIWSVAALLLAFLISAHKARWLPEFAWFSFGKETQPEEETLPPPPEVPPGDEE
ncbi:hypothetical protein Pan153_37770 [Gimesia panareensis]|uniref:Uncharacterized protein n=1 Tax=Gimesia panareensis TaxID=2527978 RepID=A0A518FS04_9PLAN|nr:hypothetical protein [Gimesia panareensis]QDV19114.1 hypothetical protein Pan153_37770 [Gimesia panareensis]